jgi:endonuclease-3 related protein
MTAPEDMTRLLAAHERLVQHYDIDGWHWGHETPPFEVCIGCILVQHTSWTNVEKALTNLRAAGVWSIEAIAAMPVDELALLVRPVGTPLTKAMRLQTFAALVLAHGGFESLFAMPAEELRALLLSTSGIGPETADAMLLYAAHKLVVVHDAYTARLMRRLGLGPERDSYEAWRAWLDQRLPRDWALRWSHHAAIVFHCKETCRVRPKCGTCPLLDMCAFGQVNV